MLFQQLPMMSAAAAALLLAAAASATAVFVTNFFTARLIHPPPSQIVLGNRAELSPAMMTRILTMMIVLYEGQ